MASTLKEKHASVLDADFQVSDPPWYDLAEDIALQCATHLGVGLNRVFGRRSGPLPGILTYHRIAPHVPELPPPLHNVEPHVFREHISGLLDRGFAFWTLEDLLACYETGKAVPARTVVVTFDDGFESVHRYALPVLVEFQVPATLFVSTAYLDSSDPFPFDEWGVRHFQEAPQETYRPMSLKQCGQIADSGVLQLGAHTHTHRDFRNRPEEFLSDLEQCVEFLRHEFALTRIPFAFPFGSPGRGFAGTALARAARRAGVACGLTTDPMLVDPRSDPFTWGRFNAFAWDNSASLAAKLDGWYSWAPLCKRRIASWCRPRPVI
jgi:peptidoglycan/xylan/chitin deacetylase (PgdA/CDA1 family)